MGFVVTGTLGVLVAASRKGLIRLPDAIAALPPTFRASESLLRELLVQASERDRQQSSEHAGYGAGPCADDAVVVCHAVRQPPDVLRRYLAFHLHPR
jgi:hypothetical protein